MSSQVPKSQHGDPAWEIATLFPAQGDWCEQEYLSLQTNRLIELNEGKLEFLTMPTELHQLIAFYLCTLLRNRTSDKKKGLSLMAPFRIRTLSGKFREPDVVFMLNENSRRRKAQYWDGADLVIEVVSPDDPARDLEVKRVEYAQSGIPEYWIVDPRDRSVLVLTLESGQTQYTESGRFTQGQTAQSILLGDFQVSVSEIFDQDGAGNA